MDFGGGCHDGLVEKEGMLVFKEGSCVSINSSKGSLILSFPWLDSIVARELTGGTSHCVSIVDLLIIYVLMYIIV